MLDEIWKPIIGYENIYEISNYGKVRRISYNNNGNKTQYNLPYYIKPRKDKDGYLRYTLSLNGKNKQFFCHRLVAQAFISNPDKLPVVNHRDGNKENCYFKNLEWTSIRDNNLHALKIGLRDMKNNKLSKEVEQYDLNGNLINTFKSGNDVNRMLGYSAGHVRDCCRGALKTYKGFIWKYKVN